MSDDNFGLELLPFRDAISPSKPGVYQLYINKWCIVDMANLSIVLYRPNKKYSGVPQCHSNESYMKRRQLEEYPQFQVKFLSQVFVPRLQADFE